MPLPREALSTVTITGANAALGLVNTAINNHRMDTHNSVAYASPRVEKFSRAIGSWATDSKPWAGVHTIHHSTPDADLYPFVELADLMDWAETRTDAFDLDTPSTLHGMDPVLDEVSLEDARGIGATARELVAGRYTPLENYDPEDIERILNGRGPRYHYDPVDEVKDKIENPIDFDPSNPPPLETMRFLLRDPHSPALHRLGIVGVYRDNRPLYSAVERQLVSNPELLPDHLKPDEFDLMLRENRGKTRMGYVAASAAVQVGAGMLERRRISTPTETLFDAARGSAAAGLGVLALINGGNLTNAVGHGGDLSKLSLRDLRDGVVHPNPDGTFETNSILLAAPSLDEVGGQYEHHRDPSLIAYTNDSGIKGVLKAPFGSVVKMLARNDLVITEGPGFEESSGFDGRPDMPSAAVTELQRLRAERLALLAA